MKKKNAHQADLSAPKKNTQKSKGRVKPIFDDKIAFDDKTGFKSNEEKIKLLAHAISSINECVCITDTNNKLIFVNDAFVKTYGYSRKELIGQTIDVVRSQNLSAEYAESIHAATIQKGWVGEIVNRKKDGTEFPISLSTAIVHDDNGDLIGLIGIASDITKQRHHELVLEESEQRYKNIFHNSSAVKLLIELETGKIIDANSSACEYYGYSKEQITLLNISDINTATPEQLSSELNSAANKTKNHFFFKHKLASGKLRDVEVYSGPVEINGKKFLHSIIHDITEKREIEEALRSERELFIGGPVTVFKWKATPEAPTEYVSPNVKTTLGYDPEEFLNNSVNFKQLVHPDDQRRVFTEVKNNIDCGIYNYEQQYRIKNKNGTYRWYSDFTRVISNEEGKITNFHGYLFDNTAQKEAEEALTRSEQELRDTNKKKDKFFSIISHDLRSPFQGLIGMANILVEDDELTLEERKDFSQKLFDGLKAQFNFIDDLLTWNRIQRGVIEFDPTPNDLSSLIKETISLLNSGIENKGLNLSLDLPENLLFNFDRNMIATVVRNLISNAIKFTSKGGNIKIIIKELPDSISGIIQDTGVGINQVDLGKFWSVDTHYSTKGTEGEGGTGLGLILCKEFIEKHQGTISVQSQIGEGSTFSFSIPKNLEGSLQK